MYHYMYNKTKISPKLLAPRREKLKFRNIPGDDNNTLNTRITKLCG